jgi:hypothetical protein
MQDVPVLDSIHQGGSGTEAGIGGHRVMPSIPVSEMALSHAQEQVLWAWGIEERVTAARTVVRTV